MNCFRMRKGIVKAVVLIAVLLLLLVPVVSFSVFQAQNQSMNRFVSLFPSGGGSSVFVKGDVVVLGDTVIGSDVSWVNESVGIILNGNLTVESGGSLSLSNVTLMVNCSFDGEHRIEVQSGGSLFINDTDGDPSTRGDASNVTALNSSNSYLFWVDSGATFQMNNSEVHYCGYWKWPEPSNLANGLWINANNSIIENNTLSNNYVGILLDNAHHNMVRNNNITNNENIGLEVYYSSNNNITGNRAEGNTFDGFYLGHSSDNILIDNIAINNGWYGFWLSYNSTSNNTLVGNTALDNWNGFVLTSNANNNNLTGNFAVNNSNDIFDDYGFYLNSSSDNNLTGNTAVNSEYGFFVNASSSGNDLFGDDAVNCSVQGYYLGADCVGNNLSGSVVSNFLRVRVVDLNGVPVSGVDVRVASNGTNVYASPGYGGSNSSTGDDGLTEWFAVPYQKYSGVTPSGLIVEAWVSGFGYRVVDMSSSHTETFTEAEDLLSLVLYSAAQAVGYQSAQNVLVVGQLSVVGAVLVVFALALYMLRRRA